MRAFFRLSGVSFAVIAGLACLANPSVAGQVSINLATGLDSAYTLLGSGGLSDAHWNVDQVTGAPAPAQSVYPNNADWYGGWLANGPGSTWIARNASTSANGLGVYTRTFDLTGVNLSTAFIQGSWAIDDSGTLNLNGHLIASLGSGAWGVLTAFSVVNPTFFNQGMNTLTIQITNTDNFLEAVRLEGTVTASASVPEPATLCAGGLGALALVLVARRRRSN